MVRHYLNSRKQQRIADDTGTSFDPRYLTAKKSIDDRALNHHVWETLRQTLPPSTDSEPVKILELGAGIGTTGSGAGRFGDMIAFESYILNIIYQIGIFSLPLIVIHFLAYYYGLYKGRILDYMVGVHVCALFQQTFETPSINTSVWMILLASIVKAKLDDLKRY